MNAAAGSAARFGWKAVAMALAIVSATRGQAPMAPPVPPMPVPPAATPGLAPAPAPVAPAVPASPDGEVAAGLPAIPPDAVRDPFWPVGYSPAPPPSVTPTNKPVAPQPVVAPVAPVFVRPEPKPDWESARSLLEVRGVTRSANKVTALVSGAIVTPGDKVRVTRDGFVYEWDVVDITAEGLKLKQRKAVPVGRQE